MEDTERIEIRLLTESDIPAAMKLKESAGWNQTENDWRCLLRLEPRGCFGATRDGQLLGTTTTTTYDKVLAWIGMVLVQPENRRSGIATRLLRTALDYLSDKVATVKLDATVDGKRVYERLGFRVESLIERWTGVGRSCALCHDTISVLANLDNETRRDLLALDRRVFHADRSKLIDMLVDNSCAAPVVTRDDEGLLTAYAFTRRGSNADYIGPLVTTNAEQAGSLLDRVLDQLVGQRIYIDLNAAFMSGTEVLTKRGFVKQRELIRMNYGKESENTSPFVFAIAGPEVG